MKYIDLATAEQNLLNRAQQLYCNTVEEAVGLRIRKNGITFFTARIDDPDRIQTVYCSKDSEQYKRNFANLFEE